MRRILALGAIAAVAAVVAPTPASANTCGAIVVGEPVDVVYVAVDADGSGVWIYQESNGQAGLQRGGTTALGDADTCQPGVGEGAPDTAIF